MNLSTSPIVPSKLRLAVKVIAALALVSLALEFGFIEPPLPLWLLIGVQAAAVVLYVFSRGYEFVRSPHKLKTLRGLWLDLLLLAVVLLVLVFLEVDRSRRPVLRLSALYIAAMQILLVTRLVIEAVRLNLSLSQSRLHPARLMVLTFAGLILAGTLALALPRSVQSHVYEAPDFSVGRHLVNCLFTSVSATCVTGLVVYDTGSDFTPVGQSVILILIQLGGLGIMVFGGLFGLLVGRQLSLRQSLAMQDTLGHQTLGDMRRMIWFIVASTFVIEAIGAAMLYPMWRDVGTSELRVFQSVFHAISAFCNAGFALRSDSLTAYQRAWQVYLVVIPLIIVGGLGFPVVSDLWRAMKVGFDRLTTRIAGRPGFYAPRLRHRFSLHTKIVLTTSLVLILVGTLGFVVLEWRRGSMGEVGKGPSGTVMREASFGGRILDALFLSVTCRTAGFNTVQMDADSLSPESHTLAALLMFIGGSPASTAGGVKTVALAVLCLGVLATIRGRRNVETFGRTIPEMVVRRVAAIAFIMFLLVGLAAILLMYTESVSMREAVFESVSACGTVGLSTGLTPDLTVAGRLVIIAAMFAGRLGPLTLLIALAGPTAQPRYEYPAEQVTIG
jgi:trk system potassium uptake protein TrkH